MDEANKRMTDKVERPTGISVRNWIGKENYKYWEEIIRFIDGNYPGVFPKEDWIYGGVKHGWCLRFKKSKSFCTLIPENKLLGIVIVFGAEERKKTEEILSELNPAIQKLYNNAATYHDGKWLLIPVNDETVPDIKKLLQVKRKPKKESKG